MIEESKLLLNFYIALASEQGYGDVAWSFISARAKANFVTQTHPAGNSSAKDSEMKFSNNKSLGLTWKVEFFIERYTTQLSKKSNVVN